MRDVKGFPVDRLPESCELWIDYTLEAGRNKAEKLFIDHKRRRLTHREPAHYNGTIPDDWSWQDEEIDVRQRKTTECDHGAIRKLILEIFRTHV